MIAPPRDGRERLPMSLPPSKTRLLRRLRTRRGRSRAGCFLVEGVRSASAALEAGAPIRFALVSPRLAELGGGDIEEHLSAAGIAVTRITDEELGGVADTVTPQGVVLVCDEPNHTLRDLAHEDGAGERGGNLLIADAIQDPTNLATIVRVAAAFGVSGVIVLDGSVDPWNAKVVRGSAGGCFATTIVAAPWTEAHAWLTGLGRELLGASTDGEDVAGVDVTPPWVIAVGNEGAGLRPAVRAAAARLVAVPMRAGSDSLNAGVAAAILAYELSRRRDAG